MRAIVCLSLSLASLVAAPVAPKKKPEPAKPLSSAQKADYAKVIQPMFDAHCVSCHGPKKEKGKLRLDTLEATAGDVMPPKDEKPMSEKQKEALYAFVEGQPIPEELVKVALADTKAALTATKVAPKAKK